MKLVSVVWEDAVSSHEEWTEMRDVRGELDVVVTTGYEIVKSEACITVALSLSEDQCRNTITIPMACVTGIYSIEDPTGVSFADD